MNKYLRITDIDDVSHDFREDDLTSPDTDLSAASNYQLHNGEILFARTGASVGKSYIYRESDGLVFFAGFLIRAKIRPGYDAEFIFQNTLGLPYERYIQVTSQRSGQPGVNAQEYAEYAFMVPSYAEQTRIGGFLRQIDTLITLHQRKQKCLISPAKFILDHIRGDIYMVFDQESAFEEALIDALTHKGWESTILRYPTEADLIRNWANILFENNRGIDRLNDAPLTDGEMQQILEQIATLRTPLRLNGFINGKTVTLTRDNPADTLHFGKEVSLKIYDRQEIAAGQSRYQIVQQPRFASKSKVLQNRRGDLMLLINGMPVIHIELKKSGVSVSQAANQIEKYAHEGIFTGIFSLIQIFVAMEPAETVYFANPGPDGKFNKDFYFHWADANNEPINDWQRIASDLLSIPMAHQLIGFYTVADSADGILKVMRSYQYYAASRISDRVSKIHWDGLDRLGGYIWHTTGSGKTMTSFKSAQLIANSRDADKVVFLVDRIELGTQSLKEYRAFADDSDDVQATEDTVVLIDKLKSNDPAKTLIVTSIQKMSRIAAEDDGRHQRDIDLINRKRIVFIVDECHRSVFGDMMHDVKRTFPNAVFFGFSGTPIFDGAKKMSDTSDVFGNELHRYTIADGIRDKNVLGFDPYMVMTYPDKDVRTVIAVEKAKAHSVEEALADPAKCKVFYHWMNASLVPMAGVHNSDSSYTKGIEDYLPAVQYQHDTHVDAVVEDIVKNFVVLSHGGKFHAIFATSSIPEALVYYRRFKKNAPHLKVTALFDPSIDNSGEGQLAKEDGLVELITDYNARYGQDFRIQNFALMKKDIAARLAHKAPYQYLAREPSLQIDILIVVDQMLTGYDSKWINTLYMDKVLRGANIIQAFSRTNRLWGPDKPFGTIRYYRYPHTMRRLVDEAIKQYSGDRPIGLFVQKLGHNLIEVNRVFGEIQTLFDRAGQPDFSKNPEDIAVRGKFAKLFRELNEYLEAAKVQGFVWDILEYSHTDEDTGSKQTVHMDIDENTYLILAQRYKELFSGNAGDSCPDIPYEIDSHLMEINTGRIDSEYMNSRFKKYLRELGQKDIDPEELQATLDDLHKSFAALTQDEQKFATIFLHDVQCAAVQVEPGKTFREYVTEYMVRAKNDQVHRLAVALGLDENQLRALMNAHVNKQNINEFGRFEALKSTVNRATAKSYFERIDGCRLTPPKLIVRIDQLLRAFILNGGIDIE